MFGLGGDVTNVGTIFSLPFLHSICMNIADEGRAEPCLRQVFRDPIGLGFRWTRLDSTAFCGLRSLSTPLFGRRHLLV